MNKSLNIENGRKLIAALRSGDYPKTRGVLHRIEPREYPDADKVGYCCLGVACDLFMKETGIGHWTVKGNREEFYINEEEHSGFTLPPTVARWLGVNEQEGNIAIDLPRIRRISEVNDISVTFEPVIAALIEAYPELSEATDA